MPLWGSNSWPSDYDTDALPTAPRRHLFAFLMSRVNCLMHCSNSLFVGMEYSITLSVECKNVCTLLSAWVQLETPSGPAAVCSHPWSTVAQLTGLLSGLGKTNLSCSCVQRSILGYIIRIDTSTCSWVDPLIVCQAYMYMYVWHYTTAGRLCCQLHRLSLKV